MRIPTEDEEHIQFADFLRAGLRKGVIWWHTPNQGQRKAQWAHKLKKMGLKAGVHDFMLYHNGQLYSIELKRSKRPAPISPDQRAWGSDLTSQGAQAAYCKGCGPAIEQVKKWGLVR